MFWGTQRQQVSVCWAHKKKHYSVFKWWERGTSLSRWTSIYLSHLSAGWWRTLSLWTKWGKCWTGCRQWCAARLKWNSSTLPIPTCFCSGSCFLRQRSFTFDCRVTFQSWRTGEIEDFPLLLLLWLWLISLYRWPPFKKATSNPWPTPWI